MSQLAHFRCRAILPRRPPPLIGQRALTTASPVDSLSVPFAHANVSDFRRDIFNGDRPTLLKDDTPLESPGRGLVASSKWFTRLEGQSNELATFSQYMSEFSASPLFPYELTRSAPTGASRGTGALDVFIKWLSRSDFPMDAIIADMLLHLLERSNEGRFVMFEAPLRLLIKAVEFNSRHKGNLGTLYIAQSPVSHLPAMLQADLPTPRIVSEGGKGDLYNSSIWLGLEPTFTPLHRDPNPNLFCQLLGRKTIRLLPPTTGDRLYAEIQSRLRRNGNSRIRGFEMMDGPERQMIDAATWGSEAPADCIEAAVEAGDALFIPTGWWHSVKSTHLDGRLNASVNWWFR